jgi:hypothetical protein
VMKEVASAAMRPLSLTVVNTGRYDRAKRTPAVEHVSRAAACSERWHRRRATVLPSIAASHLPRPTLRWDRIPALGEL